MTTFREIQLCCGFTDQQAADYCGVSLYTHRRWRRTLQPSVAAVRLLAVRAGAAPWPEWQGWEVHGGRLFPPGWTRSGFRPGEIMAIQYLHALVAEQKRLLSELRYESESCDTKARAV